ncbi:MAG: hypothetical protein M0Z76_05075 [Gammaproteobacteria bacterium]|nr:hypothetical protein [Gammaproteobacteria bacterium]
MRKVQITAALSYAVCIGLFALSSVVCAQDGRVVFVEMGPLDHGMMGRGMMGRGMIGGGGGPAAQDLRAYIRAQGLGCFSCHRIHRNAMGPAFQDVAGRYAGRPGAEAELAHAIAYGVAGRWPNFPAMAAGLATPTQARELARLILRLQTDARP